MSALNIPGANSDLAPAKGPSEIRYLSAEWMNQRLMNVMDRMEPMIDRLLDGGLLSSGYLPFEFPITEDMVLKMTPEQFHSLYQSLPTIGEKMKLMDIAKGLKLPPDITAPRTHPATSPPTGQHVAGFDEPPGMVQSS